MKILRIDPSRTGLLRRQFIAEMNKRFGELRRALVDLIVKEDAFGLNPPPSVHDLMTKNAGKYAFLTSDRKLDAFNAWLDQMLDSKLLTVDNKKEPWTSKYINGSYRKGVVRAYNDAHRKDFTKTAKEDKVFYQGGRASFLKDSFAAPEDMVKVRLLATRTFEGMKGMTAQMKSQMNRVLAEGLAQGYSPRQMARELVERLDVSLSRARMIARTEIIHAHAEGQLDSMEEQGLAEVGLMAEWSTAGDDAVCPECTSAAAAGPYTLKEARGMIPLHPNCRCSWIPYFPTPKELKKLKARSKR